MFSYIFHVGGEFQDAIMYHSDIQYIQYKNCLYKRFGFFSKHVPATGHKMQCL